MSLTRHLCRLRSFCTDTGWKVLLSHQKTRRAPSVVHVKKQRIEQGEYAHGSDALRALLGHDVKERAVEPDPRSQRWRGSFLRVGAFKRRSVRVEVRKREFGPDEHLQLSAPLPRHTQLDDSTDNDATIDGIPLDAFAAYVDSRLAQMETPPRLDDHSEEDTSLESSGESSELPMEFRTLPFDFAPRKARRQLSRLSWMPSDGRQGRRWRNRFRWGIWWRRWGHMWPYHYGTRRAPSSLRRFYNRPDFSTLPRQAELYVEDTVAINNKTDPWRDTALIVAFLKTQPCYCGIPDTQAEKNTFWPKRRQGAALWSFLRDVSESIRQERFRFDWERELARDTMRFYRWNRKRAAKSVRKKPTAAVPVFGSHPPVKERFHAEIRSATFRLGSSDDSDHDS